LAPLTFPPPLQPGDRIAVIAPASGFPRQEFFRGLAWLRARYAIVARTSLLERSGYLAGRDEARARTLVEAMTMPGVKAVVAARGGYGTMRLLGALDSLGRETWETFARSPRWLVGFSDVTALHAEVTARGIASIHGPNVTGLAAVDPIARAAWLRALERPSCAIDWCNLHAIRAGVASGPIVGGNLALVEAMASAGRFRPPDGAILALEDVTERPYRVDRMLTALRLGGHFARLSAIVFGEFAQCDPGPDGVTIREVLEDRTLDLGIPVLSGAPFGHGARNDAFVLGAQARIDGNSVRIGGPLQFR
jgi:muramoyltetrapeptide carboxypeptidase